MSDPLPEHENSRFWLFRDKFIIVEAVSNILFYSCFPAVWQLALYISPIFFPFSPPSLSYPLSLPHLPPVTPHENVTAAILSYAVSHLHEITGKLRKTCADTVGHLTESVPSLIDSKKWPPAQRFDVQAADRRSPIQVLTQRKAAWLRWSSGTEHLPHTEHCR